MSRIPRALGAAALILSTLTAAPPTRAVAAAEPTRTRANAAAAPAAPTRADAAAASTESGAVAAAAGGAKVVVIAEENHTYDDIFGSSAAPYLSGLATTYGSALAMDAGYPTSCPSLAAYLLMTSGDTQGVCDDRGPSHHAIAADNIFAQVAAAGLSWRDYAEDAPAPCSRTDSADGVFLVRHTPPVYYTSEQARCAVDDIPMGTPDQGALHDDVAAGTLPAYAYLTPDACDDMHGADPCGGDKVGDGDAWLSRWIPEILAGPDYRAGHLTIIITWDEGSPTSNHIPTVVVSPTTRHVASSTPYTHCSTLATTEDLLGLPLLGCARGATTMTGDFAL